jgi:transcriptional regulator with XRE-family HTH domain
MSAAYYVTGRIHDVESAGSYRERMRDIPDSPGRRFATLIKDARKAKGLTQDDLSAASGVTRQTIIRYESGEASAPRSDQVRAVCSALGIDPRDATIALGFVTREELGFPPPPSPLQPELLDIQRFLADERIPQRIRDNLLRGVKAAKDVWLDGHSIKAPKEPAPARPKIAR